MSEKSTLKTHTLYSLLGPPGAGKGTVAERCMREYDFQVLSTGNLCREHVLDKTPLGERIDDCISQGDLIPDKVVIKMVDGWLKKAVLQGNKIILDGFPRTEGQAQSFLSLINTNFSYCNVVVILFRVDKDEVIKRLLNRVVCTNTDCQAVYSLTHTGTIPKQSGVCDYCGSPLFHREDDSEHVIEDRFKIYQSNEQGLINVYDQVGVPLHYLDVTGKTTEDVFKDFSSIVLQEN